MCADPQSNWLNTIAVRASYIWPILKRFPWWKPRKTGGVSLSPPGKNQNRNQFVFLSFRANWQSFIEIREMACSTTARCSRGHALNTGPLWHAIGEGKYCLNRCCNLWRTFTSKETDVSHCSRKDTYLAFLF